MLEPKAFPLKTMRIIDDTGRLIRAPQTDFHASETKYDAFGYNVSNRDILEQFEELITQHDNIILVDGAVETLQSIEDGEQLTACDGDDKITINSSFVIGADGRNSLVRHTRKMGEREWEYRQSAIVVDFEHEYSTQFTSTEFHTQTGPFTIVPRAHHLAGLVWMESPQRVADIINMPKIKLQLLIEEKMQSFLGKVKIISKVQSFPIKGLVARKFGSQNYALIGEAAHVFPPIGAQGFNLGIRDVEAISQVLQRFTNHEDRGYQYHLLRTADIHTRTLGVDILNRSLLSDFLPTQMLRTVGLQALATISPLRKLVMKMGIAPDI